MRSYGLFYLGRGPGVIWLGTVSAADVHPDSILRMVAWSEAGSVALEATDLGSYLAGITDLFDAWVDDGVGSAYWTPIDRTPTQPADQMTPSLTYAAGRTWIRRGTADWYPATTGPGGPPETCADLDRALAFFEGIPGDPCDMLLREDTRR